MMGFAAAQPILRATRFAQPTLRAKEYHAKGCFGTMEEIPKTLGKALTNIGFKMLAMRQFIFRLTDGTETRYLPVQARDQSEAEAKVERWCKGKRWRWPIFSHE